MNAVVEVLAAVLLLLGVALFVIAGIGLTRFPDVYTRSHAATKPATLGLLLIMVGAALAVEDGGDRTKLLLVAAFQFVTAPVAAHMIGRASYRAGIGGLDALVVDELAGRQPDGPPDVTPPPGPTPPSR